jgi:hypothetical protein
MTRQWFAAILLGIAVSALAQENDRKYVIAISVDSTDSRIQQMMPELREEAAKAVEQAAENVHASVVIGSPSNPAEEARQKSADYLLTITLALLSQVDVPSKGDLGSGPVTTADVPVSRVPGGVHSSTPTGLAHSHCWDLDNEAFAFLYKVTSLSGKKIKLQSSHTMRENEYPLGPQENCLAQFSTQAVRNSASDAVKGLKSKKRI